jgi:dephospho-CoA kinase
VTPPFVAVTGGVAAGKTTALQALERLGAATLSSDAIVHDLLAEPDVREALVDRWGDGILADGGVDRRRVGEIVFRRPEELSWLEGRLHPMVGERIAAWRAALDPTVPLAVVEVPLLFESGMDVAFDATIAVVASEETRTGRAGARGTELMEGRTSRQLPQHEKAARATYVVANDGDVAELEASLAEVMKDLAAEGS